MFEAAVIYNPDLQPQPEGVPHFDELRLLSVNEARKILGVSHATLKHLIAEGEIKAVKINTRYKISLSAIKEFTESVIINVDNDIETPSHQTADSILDELINKFSK